MELRLYQEKLIEEIKLLWETNDVACLSSCPSSGKTYMASIIAQEFAEKGQKVLILAHGQIVLRTQFYSMAKEIMEDKVGMIDTYTKVVPDKEILVAIPQTLQNRDLPEIDLLIVDEAHHFYLKDLVQNIIKKIHPKKILLLTATPSALIRYYKDKEEQLPIAVEGMFQLPPELFTKWSVHVCVSKYKIEKTDYTIGDNIITHYKFDKEKTLRTLDDSLGVLLDKLRCMDYLPDKPELSNVKDFHLSKTLTQVCQDFKCMIACHNIEQATYISTYLNKFVPTLLSTSKNDVHTENIEKFKEGDYQFLVVVYRGILGFDMPDLKYIIDFTMSRNIDRIYQLLGRVLRKGKDEYSGFIKIAPKEEKDYTQHLMNAVLCLMDKKYMSIWDGKNLKDLEVPVDNDSKKNSKKSDSNSDSIKKPKPIDFGGMLDVMEFLRNIYYSGTDLNTYAFCNFEDIRQKYYGSLVSYKYEDYIRNFTRKMITDEVPEDVDKLDKLKEFLINLNDKLPRDSDKHLKDLETFMGTLFGEQYQ